MKAMNQTPALKTMYVTHLEESNPRRSRKKTNFDSLIVFPRNYDVIINIDNDYYTLDNKCIISSTQTTPHIISGIISSSCRVISQVKQTDNSKKIIMGEQNLIPARIQL